MIYTQIIKEQFLKADIEEVWDFMSSPSNLEKITPPWMLFKITSNNQNTKMYPGMIISYKVTPVLSIPITWVAEITHMKNKLFFVDEQRCGPYKMWHHEHIFEVQNNGVFMRDVITYVPPFGILGRIANVIFIRQRINYIFDYRKKVIDCIFKKKNDK